MPLTPDQRRLPAPAKHIDRVRAWELVLANEKLMHRTMHSFLDKRVGSDGYTFSVSREDMYEDLLPAAYESMLKAVEKYDLSRGNKFSTFAVHVLRNDLTVEFDRLIKQRGPVDAVISFDSVVEEREWSPAHDGMEDRVAERVDASVDFSEVADQWSDPEVAVAWMWAYGYSQEEMQAVTGLTKQQIRHLSNSWRKKGRDAAAV